jgi:hypothetical protein
MSTECDANYHIAKCFADINHLLVLAVVIYIRWNIAADEVIER